MLVPVVGAAQSFSHLDWELACDNTHTCRAAGYQSDEDENTVSVLLVRKAGPGTEVDGALRIGDADEKAPAPRRVELLVGGRSQGTVGLDAESSQGKLTPSQVASVVQAALGDGRIVLRDGSREWHLSGAGASAVLLKMDDLQGRVGTPSALTRKGARSDAAVRAPAPAPVVVAAPTLAGRPGDERLAPLIRARLKSAGDECEALAERAERAERADETRIWRLDEHRVLVSALCWRAAYNEGYGFWVANDRAPFQPKLVTAGGQDFDAATSTIGAYQKGRGIGDCIGTDEWVWDGRRFVHTAESTSGLCKGIAAGGAWDLPTLVSDVRRPKP